MAAFSSLGAFHPRMASTARRAASSRSVVGQLLATQLPLLGPTRAFHPSTLVSTLLFPKREPVTCASIRMLGHEYKTKMLTEIKKFQRVREGRRQVC